ncbi:heme exporter protein A/Cu-processing system ATP-binding protein [Amycolatopsis marina]|uniref:Heme exporter protein A/Cu-processing system ATP-binding protein n=1 Tax=Amycolatopsis marina TaxID=490629 RepID=A0A1I1CJ42_9PSEU|nr:heme ABC exporter ATP-binding protein CcmA [Amycolatopsis marina]SFB62725.1 heme exporter protein A/Cu-processing system ATP-binding protein [Amycolatopsis marina]
MPSPVPDTDHVAMLVGVAVDVERAPVLRSLDFAVAPGESVGLVGANGSGKSTLLRVLATLLPPVGGHGHVLGAALGSAECAVVRPRIALVGHTAALYPRLTVRENLRFLARLTGRREHAADEALEAVGLAGAADRRADACSQGMQRRAELARVLLTEPRLLLLDEAHTGLDPASTGLVNAVAEQVRERGGASVVVSHDHARLRGAADRLVEIVEGRARPVRAEVPA